MYYIYHIYHILYIIYRTNYMCIYYYIYDKLLNNEPEKLKVAEYLVPIKLT